MIFSFAADKARYRRFRRNQRRIKYFLRMPEYCEEREDELTVEVFRTRFHEWAIDETQDFTFRTHHYGADSVRKDRRWTDGFAISANGKVEQRFASEGEQNIENWIENLEN